MASVGIDLGTTYSCVAGVKNGKIEVIANRHGSRIMPSWVAFTDTERLVGETAKSASMSEPQNTVYDAKRIIGRHFNDVDLLSDIKRWPFCVFNAQGKPKMRVQYKKKTQEFFPEEISGMVLLQMKEIAQNYLGKEVKKAVITVPAYFGMEQRKATIDAAKCAGLEVLEIVNEPTAAAFAFGLLEKSVEQRNVLIYDLGGGTFDVTVMTITGREKFDVKATSGNTHLGGQDFNENLVQYLIEVIDKECDIDISSQPRKLAQLRADCERVKIELSSGFLATVRLYGLCDGDDFETSVGRAKFEELNEELFESTLDIVDKALEEAGMSECDIDDVALVGGSTRIPKIQELLKEHFEDIELTMSNNPDESVAYGAGVRAAVLGKETVAGIRDMEVRDVIPLSLGVGVFGGATSFIIKRNTKIPCNKTHNFTTLFDNQTGVDIEIFEGERARSANNKSIGSIYLTDITPALAGDAKIEVTFKVGENGSSLAASATERSSGKEAALTISLDDGRFSESEVEDLIARSEKFRIDDEEFREKTKALNELVSQTNKVRRDLRRKKKRQDELHKCEEIYRWASETKDPSREEIDQKRQELENLHEYF